jgi:hypothetical protein
MAAVNLFNAYKLKKFAALKASESLSEFGISKALTILFSKAHAKKLR